MAARSVPQFVPVFVTTPAPVRAAWIFSLPLWGRAGEGARGVARQSRELPLPRAGEGGGEGCRRRLWFYLHGMVESHAANFSGEANAKAPSPQPSPRGRGSPSVAARSVPQFVPEFATTPAPVRAALIFSLPLWGRAGEGACGVARQSRELPLRERERAGVRAAGGAYVSTLTAWWKVTLQTSPATRTPRRPHPSPLPEGEGAVRGGALGSANTSQVRHHARSCASRLNLLPPPLGEGRGGGLRSRPTVSRTPSPASGRGRG